MRIFSFFLLCLASFAGAAQPPALSGVSFPDTEGRVYVPAKQLATALDLPYTEDSKSCSIDKRPLPETRALYDGTKLVALKDLGANLRWDPVLQTVALDFQGKSITVKLGAKRVEINKKAQRLRAYQGDLLVLQTHVSTGRKGHRTPSGEFSASSKSRIHYSHLYDDSPMPWAVQIDGNVFMHGFTSVPKHPASHGCVRIPLTGRNPAKWLYHWIDLGTPVSISDRWATASALGG